jgi:hypothetical protein
MPAHRSIAPLLVALGLLAAARAQAITPFVPLEDRRFIHVEAEYFGDHDTMDLSPSAPFADFLEPNITAYAADPDQGGDCTARAGQLSTVIDSIGYMAFQGGAEGGWGGPPEGTWSAVSLARVKFRLLTCAEFNLRVTVVPGDCPGLGVTCTEATLEGLNGLTYEKFDDVDNFVLSGRLAPGDYALEGRSGLTSSEEFAGGGAYTIVWNCYTCPWMLILDPPHDKKAAPGSDPNLVASAAVPTGHMTYQWRRNLTPLVDGGVALGAGRLAPLTDSGHITGSRTPILTIHNMSAADTGYYDVVFTDSSNVNNVIVEPSSLAHLELDTVTAVEDGSGSAPRAFTVSPAAPNPFASATSFRYESTSPAHVTMAIYNVAGARVRLLLDELVPGSRTITWDGKTTSGVRAPAGIYYMLVDANGVRETRKVALLR